MKLTLNVGCGERTYSEYPEGSGFKCINYDARGTLPNVDVIGDVQKLNFQDEFFDYILASDIIEHFPISVTENILKEWKRVLKQGGIIELRLPNLREICEKYLDGTNDAKLTSWLIMGGQDYPENYHFVIFDKNWLTQILAAQGLEVIHYSNGGHNMLVKAKKL